MAKKTGSYLKTPTSVRPLSGQDMQMTEKETEIEISDQGGRCHDWQESNFKKDFLDISESRILI